MKSNKQIITIYEQARAYLEMISSNLESNGWICKHGEPNSKNILQAVDNFLKNSERLNNIKNPSLAWFV